MVAELNPSGFQQKRSNSNVLLLKDYSSRRLPERVATEVLEQERSWCAATHDWDDDEQLCIERQPGSLQMDFSFGLLPVDQPARIDQPNWRPTPPTPASGNIKVMSRIPYFRLILASCNMSHDPIISGTSIRWLPMSISAARVMHIADREIVSNWRELGRGAIW